MWRVRWYRFRGTDGENIETALSRVRAARENLLLGWLEAQLWKYHLEKTVSLIIAMAEGNKGAK